MLKNPLFEPDRVPAFKDDRPKARQPTGDRRDGRVYVYTPEIKLAVNVALATGRPLLVRGPAGSGKSSLAPSVARAMNWRYYEEVISSRTQARDLQWRFDTLRRLNDAQANKLDPEPAAYVEPGVLWWAFNPTTAYRRGYPKGVDPKVPAREPGEGRASERAVVLLDEIDKADPDVPNDLLVPIGSRQFVVQETQFEVTAASPPLLIITSNDERELPTAFLRRCVILVFDRPGEKRLIDIATAHFGTGREDLYRSIARRVVKLTRAVQGATQRGPSSAEFLDTIQACLDLDVMPKARDKTWQAIERTTLWKPRSPRGAV